MIEYRICWTASSNINFRGESDWEESNEGETEEEIQEALDPLGTNISDGLAMALEFSGFEWWVETREPEESSA